MEDLELMCVMIIAFGLGKLLFEKLDLYFDDLRIDWREEEKHDEK